MKLHIASAIRIEHDLLGELNRMRFIVRTNLMRPSLSSALLLCASTAMALLFALSAPAQQFPNPPMLTTSEDPNGVGTADWNGDGNADLAYVTTGQTPVLHLLLGDGKGNFTPGNEVTLPEGTCTYSTVACRIFSADFGHTGHPGILVAGSYAAVWGFLYLPGNGDGTFGTPVLTILPPPLNGSGVGFYIGFMLGIADFNGDSNLDIAAPDYYDGQIRIYLGDGKGGFTPGAVIQDVGQPSAIYASDLNHDGRTDLLVLNVYGTLGFSNGAAVYLGDGTGNFSYKQSYPSGNQAFAPRWAADINGDSYLDVLGVDGLGDVQVITGNADGSFNAPQTIASGFEGQYYQSVLYTADITGSGIPSILVGSNEGFDTAVPSASMKYSAVQKRTSGILGVQVAFADFNSDGAQDMAAGVTGGIQLFYGNKSGLFPDSSITATPASTSILFAGDFNGDGVADVASPGADGVMRTYPGSKSGVFQAPVQSSATTSTNFSYIGNTVGDFDGDGHQDILLNGNVLYGNGDGTFTTVQTATASNGLVADLNKDGKSDLFSISSLQTGSGSYNYYFALNALLGTAQRSFTQVSTSMGLLPPGAGITVPVLLAVSDLNGDGIPDAAILDPNVNKLETWLGNGDGSFKAGPQLSLTNTAWSPQSVGSQSTSTGFGFIADLDGDGKADLAFLAGESATDSKLPRVTVLVVEYGDGNGGFSSTQVIPLSHAYTSVVPMYLAAGTLPGFALDSGTVLAVVRNLGGRQFSNEDFYSAGTSIGILTVDFNGDDLSDLLVTRANGLFSPSPQMLGFTVLLDQAPASGNGDTLSNGALTATPSTVDYNQPFTLTAVVLPAVTGADIPTGTVNFSTVNLPLGSAQLVAGTATLPVSGATTQQLMPGIQQINAAYSGDSAYAPTYLTTTLVVQNPQYATTTTLTLTSAGSPVTSIQAGSFITLTAAVTAPIAIPHGIIAFYDGTKVLGQTEISNGSAVFSTNLLVPGSHSLSARYMGYVPPSATLGTSDFLASASSATALTVTSIPTITTLNASSPTITAGTVVTLGAGVMSGSGTPIGGVTFYDGTTALGTYSLDAGGNASFSTASLTTGSHTFTAQYILNSPWAGSSSSPVSVTAQAAPVGLVPTTTIISAVTPSSGPSLSATVQVSGTSLPSGMVTLLADGQIAAAVPFTGGTLSVPLSLGGTTIHNLVASYSGSATAAPSASPQLQTTSYLQGADFTLQPAQPQISIPSSGPSSAATLLIGSVNGWSGAVSLSCISGLPPGYSCSFSPSTLTGPGAVTLTLVQNSELPALGLLLVPGLWFLRSRNPRRILVALLLLVSLELLSACSSNSATRSAQPWVVTVQATSGSTLHSTQIEFRSGSGHQSR